MAYRFTLFAREKHHTRDDSRQRPGGVSMALSRRVAAFGSRAPVCQRHRTGALCGKLLLSVFVSMICGCSDPAIQDAKDLDQQIEKRWMTDRQSVEAIPFLQQGGHDENIGAPDELDVDQPFLLPFLIRLRDELDLKPLALLETPEQAMAVIIEIPGVSAKRNQLRKVLQKADDTFPGLLMDNWGLTWVSIDYLDDREVDVLKRAGKYEVLKNQLELRRRKVE